MTNSTPAVPLHHDRPIAETIAAIGHAIHRHGYAQIHGDYQSYTVAMDSADAATPVHLTMTAGDADRTCTNLAEAVDTMVRHDHANTASDETQKQLAQMQSQLVALERQIGQIEHNVETDLGNMAHKLSALEQKIKEEDKT